MGHALYMSVLVKCIINMETLHVTIDWAGLARLCPTTSNPKNNPQQMLSLPYLNNSGG